MSYILDKEETEQMKRSTVPTQKDMYPAPEEQISEHDIKAAQKLVGEFLWVSTRTRPEITYAVSRCSAVILTAPKWACDTCATTNLIWGYLKETPDTGLWFGRSHGPGVDFHGSDGLRAYSAINFAPLGDESISHGAIFVLWNGSLMWWRSGKQPFPTLLTAESELVEGIEAFVVGDSIDAIVSEFEEKYIRSLLIDN